MLAVPCTLENRPCVLPRCLRVHVFDFCRACLRLQSSRDLLFLVSLYSVAFVCLKRELASVDTDNTHTSASVIAFRAFPEERIDRFLSVCSPSVCPERMVHRVGLNQQGEAGLGEVLLVLAMHCVDFSQFTCGAFSRWSDYWL